MDNSQSGELRSFWPRGLVRTLTHLTGESLRHMKAYTCLCLTLKQQEWVCSAMTSVLRRSSYTLFLSGVGRQKNRLRFTRSLLDTASQNPITRAHADTGMHCVPTREHGSLQPDLANSPVLVIWESAWIGIFESVTIL